MEESAPSVVSAESMEPVASEERMEESMGYADTQRGWEEEQPDWDEGQEQQPDRDEECMESMPPPWKRAASEECMKSMGSVASEECMESVPPPWKRAAIGRAKPGDWICKVCGNLNFNRRGFCAGRHGTCGQSRQSNWKPGDWYCTCGNHNMAFRTHCNRKKCGLPRAQGEQR